MMLAPMKEMDIYGVFVPPLLIWGMVSFLAVKLCHAFLARRDFYRSEIEQQIFNVSLFVILTSLLSFFVP